MSTDDQIAQLLARIAELEAKNHRLEAAMTSLPTLLGALWCVVLYRVRESIKAKTT